MIEYKEGKVIKTAYYHEKMYFDLSNLVSSLQCDGNLGISSFSLSNKYHVFVKNSYYGNIEVKGSTKHELQKKIVSMLGSIQEVQLQDICSTTYYARTTPSIVITFDQEVTYHFGFALDLVDLALYKGKEVSFEVEESKNELKIMLKDVGTLYVQSDGEFFLKEIEGSFIHSKVDNATYLKIEVDTCREYKEIIEEAIEYNQRLINNEYEGFIKSYYASCMNASLSMWKEIDEFKGLFAGIHYQRPARTYYRDSYYTALPLVKEYPLLMKEQILTLARGVFDDLSTPSGVGMNGQYWWKDHHDGLFYIFLLLDEYDVIHKDESIYEEEVKGSIFKEFLVTISNHLLTLFDQNNLFYRKPYDRHDWVDNVYREGYIMYIQSLGAQACKIAGRILQDERYSNASTKIIEGIERVLWNEEKGYYSNYKNDLYHEDHCSIDTVLYAYFDLGNKERKRSMLERMENILESKNNKDHPFGSFGTFSVFPPYQYKEHLVEKSSYPYYYHNGSDWPYFSSIYALTKFKNDMEYEYSLFQWFHTMIEEGHYTPIEFYTPTYPVGGMLQGWSGVGAYTLQQISKRGNLVCNNIKN